MKELKKKVSFKNTTQKRNNKGMTYIELLVALSLLVLIVTMFSPMLLNAYDTIYRAGEITSDAFDAREKIEQGLSLRQSSTQVNVITNFEKFSGAINVKARQVLSAVNGLEALYTGVKARLLVVSDSIVIDNQDIQRVVIQTENLTDKTFSVASTVQAAKNPGANEVRFYVHSAFDDTKAIACEDPKVDSTTGDVELIFNGVDVTMSPIKILGYYRNDYGKVKSVSTYMIIEPADMIFVGDTTSKDYFTSAGFDKENNKLYISGRKMTTAPINGDMINDVEWVGTENDSSIMDGYYLMCGEKNVVRRLWRARDSSKGQNIKYNFLTVGGEVYYQYDWKGDFTDQYQFSVKGSEAVYQQANHAYSLKGGYLTYGYSGNTSDDDELVDHHWYPSTFDAANRRLSYVVSDGTLEEALKPERGLVAPRNGLWSRLEVRQPALFSSKDRFNGADSDSQLYAFKDGYWYKRNGKSSFSQDTSMPLGTWTAGKNANSLGVDVTNYGFYIRKSVVGTKWGGNETSSSDSDAAFSAPLILRAYNNYSFDHLKSADWLNAPTANTINLSSCIALPGKGGETLYTGTTDAYAMVNETTGFDPYESGFRENGFFNTRLFAGSNGNTKYTVISQIPETGKTEWWSTVLESHNGGSQISPDRYHWKTAVSSMNSTSISGWKEYADTRFTMGYSSNLSAIYDKFIVQPHNGDDDNNHLIKPLEKYYLGSLGKTTADSTDYDNLWFTREFYNITESDSYNTSVVAVGYNVSGYATQGYINSYSEPGRRDFTLLKVYGNEQGVVSQPSPYVDSTYWVECKYNDGYYAMSCQGGDSEHEFVVQLPASIVAYTELEKITNDGVLSVYNEGDGSFTPIYYYKDPNKKSVRFNCVSTISMGDDTVGAAVGFSDGSVMLANIPYSNGKLLTTTLTAGNCPKADPIPEISSITAIKTFWHDINGDGNGEALIVAGGVKAAGQALVLRVCDVTDLATYYNEYTARIEANGTNITEITDIAIVNGYIYVSAKTSSNTGVIYSCSLEEFSNVVKKQNIKWDKTNQYYTTFAADQNGKIIGVSGSGLVDLPVINSIAAKAEQ